MTRQIFAKKRHLDNAKLIYSLWDGYLKKDESFWKENNVPILKVHCSGHAYVEDLQKFVKAINPKCIIPIHTFLPEKYSEYFGSNVKLVKDGTVIEIS